jgi:hypothetical protein
VSSVLLLGLGVKTVIRASRDFRDAHDHVSALREEVLEFAQLAERAQEILQGENIPDGILRKAVAEIEKAGETIQELNMKLELVQNTSTRRASGLKWIRAKSKCLKLQGRLRRHHQVLTNCLQLVQMSVHHTLYPLLGGCADL